MDPIWVLEERESRNQHEHCIPLGEELQVMTICDNRLSNNHHQNEATNPGTQRSRRRICITPGQGTETKDHVHNSFNCIVPYFPV